MPVSRSSGERCWQLLFGDLGNFCARGTDPGGCFRPREDYSLAVEDPDNHGDSGTNAFSDDTEIFKLSDGSLHES